MKKIAIYGKGGIGKSTVTSSLAAAISKMGYRVMQIGCDPKADSTINLINGQEITTVIQYLKENGSCDDLKEIIVEGYNGVLCIEAGGPSPGIGCAGRGIITAFEVLEELNAYEILKPDVVLFDVLGDVVCGGFAVPIRNGYADEVIIVTSGEKMSLFAARNIKMAVDSFSHKNYAKLRGIILNKRNIKGEEEIVLKHATEMECEILGSVPRDPNIQLYEEKNMTVVQGDSELDISKIFMGLAEEIVKGGEGI